MRRSIEFDLNQPLQYDLPEHGISAPFLTSLQQSFGIIATRTLVNFTYGACDLSRIVDDCIDYPDRQTPETFDDLLWSLQAKVVPGLDDIEAERSLQYASSLNASQMEYARKIYRDAVCVAEQRNGAETLADYIEAISDEAKVQCAALYVSESAEHPDQKQRIKFNTWLESLVLAGYLVDSAVDLQDDFKEGRTQIAPSIQTRVALIKAAFPYGLRVFASMPAKSYPLVGSLFVDMNIKARRLRIKEQAELRNLLDMS